MRAWRWPLAVCALIWADHAFAAAVPGVPAVTVAPAPGGGQTYSLTVEALLLLASLSMLPAVLLVMTAFTRIVIVLALLRQALGSTHVPPNQVLVGVSLILTLVVMAPVFERIYQDAYVPLSARRIALDEAVKRAAVPLRGFMLRQTREADLALFGQFAGEPAVRAEAEVPLKVLLPAYVISELKTAFQIGFIVFIPFLVIDLVVSSTLMSLGMIMLPPVVVSLPFKLMLFVLVDGWNLLVGSLLRTFH